jgi:hypothetical protein
MMKKSDDKTSSVKSPAKKKMTAREREEILIENFVGLQMAMTNLSIRFEKLSDNITRLLMIFETAAKEYVDNSPKKERGDIELLEKINSLLDQNKTIAKGLVLMEDKLRNRTEMPGFESQERQRPRPLPQI